MKAIQAMGNKLKEDFIEKLLFTQAYKKCNNLSPCESRIFKSEKKCKCQGTEKVCKYFRKRHVVVYF